MNLHFLLSATRRLLSVFAAFSLSGCLSYEPAQLIPELTLSGENVSFSSANASERQIDFGLTVGDN
jgi:hypothetical protein